MEITCREQGSIGCHLQLRELPSRYFNAPDKRQGDIHTATEDRKHDQPNVFLSIEGHAHKCYVMPLQKFLVSSKITQLLSLSAVVSHLEEDYNQPFFTVK